MDADTKQTLLFNLGHKLSSKISSELTLQYAQANNPSKQYPRDRKDCCSTLLVEPHINLAEKMQTETICFSGRERTTWSTVEQPALSAFKSGIQLQDRKSAFGWEAEVQNQQPPGCGASASLQTSNYNSEYYPIGYQTISPNLNLNNGNYSLATQQNVTRNGQLQVNYNRTTGNLVWVSPQSMPTSSQKQQVSVVQPEPQLGKSLDVTEPSTR